MDIDEIISKKFAEAFEKAGYDIKYAIAKPSDRPDLSDFQCNGALALAKPLRLAPAQIATNIVEHLKFDTAFEKITIDGPGFINISLKNDYAASMIDELAKDKRLGVEKVEEPKTAVLDFGGPNVAKALHVGHLRSGVIGESAQRIFRFVGDNVISDVHFGDWGTPIGMIITGIQKRGGDYKTLTVEEITKIYKQESALCKEDENEQKKARLATAKFQDGDPEFRAIWQYIRNVSVEDVKKNYEALDVNFDLWLGESDAQEDSKRIIGMAKEKGILEFDDGAQIIRLEESNKPKPPVIIEKSDGGFGYQLTDIATALSRVRDLKADEIIYFTDKRQSFHFEQIFEVIGKLGFADGVKFKHIGFGTVNGPDGKPFKTRDGGVMNLEDLIRLSKEKVRESMPAPSAEYDAKYIDNLVDEIAVGAIKFQDLKANIASDYIFEVDDFANFEGKTGPYIQYAIARINSILRKVGAKDGAVMITNKEERDLALKIMQFRNAVYRAYNDVEPSVVSDYVYTLAQIFSSFYNASPIASVDDSAIQASRLRLAKITRDIMVQALDLLGIKSPEVMLKR